MMRFTKMHGCGNDYVYINCFRETVESPGELAKAVSNRHFGIGSDGLVLICPSDKADCRMRMFNPDGSESEMCGNAVRCVAKYVYDRNIIHKKSVTVETLAGIRTVDVHIRRLREKIEADSGNPLYVHTKWGVGYYFLNKEK